MVVEKDAGVFDVGDRIGLPRHALEERRAADVGGVLIPRELITARDLERVPALVAVKYFFVALSEHVRLHRLLDGLRDLAGARPDVLQEHRLPMLVLPQRLVIEVDVHRSRQRIGDAQGRRGQVVHLHVGIDAALEVAVARQHRYDR